MAKATVMCMCKKCGKEFKHSKEFSNRSEADNYETWAAANIDTCPECYKEAQRAKNVEKENAAIGDVYLTDLEGTEKQIKWAMDIRRAAIAGVMPYKPQATFFDMVNSKNTAIWWINNRDSFDNPNSFVKSLKNN